MNNNESNNDNNIHSINNHESDTGINNINNNINEDNINNNNNNITTRNTHDSTTGINNINNSHIMNAQEPTNENNNMNNTYLQSSSSTNTQIVVTPTRSPNQMRSRVSPRIAEIIKVYEPVIPQQIPTRLNVNFLSPTKSMTPSNAERTNINQNEAISNEQTYNKINKMDDPQEKVKQNNKSKTEHNLNQNDENKDNSKLKNDKKESNKTNLAIKNQKDNSNNKYQTENNNIKTQKDNNINKNEKATESGKNNNNQNHGTGINEDDEQHMEENQNNTNKNQEKTRNKRKRANIDSPTSNSGHKNLRRSSSRFNDGKYVQPDYKENDDRRRINPTSSSSTSRTASSSKKSNTRGNSNANATNTSSQISSSSSSTISSRKYYYCGTACMTSTTPYETEHFQAIVQHMQKVHKLNNPDLVRALREVPAHASFKEEFRICNVTDCAAPVMGKNGYSTHYNKKHKLDRGFQMIRDNVGMPPGQITVTPIFNPYEDYNDVISNTEPFTPTRETTNAERRLLRHRRRNNTSTTTTTDNEEKGYEVDESSESDSAYEPHAIHNENGNEDVDDDEDDDMLLEQESQEKVPFDYFEETLSDNSTILHDIQISNIKREARSVIREILAYSEEDLVDYLCGVSHPRLNQVNHGHIEVFRNINNRLLHIMLREDEISHENTEDSESSDENMTIDNYDPNTSEEHNRPLSFAEFSRLASIAHFLLPTIYRMVKTSKRALGKTTQKSYFQALESSRKHELIGCICYLFKLGRSKLTREDIPQRIPSKPTIAKRVNQLVIAEGHVSRGMNYLCRYADSDATNSPQHLSPEEFKQKVQELHPERHGIYDDLVDDENIDEDDEFDDNTHTTPISEMFDLTASVLNSTIRRLKRDSTPGWDGWTFQLIRQLYEEHDINDETPSLNAQLLIKFIRFGLAGSLPLHKLWNVSKMILIPEWKAASSSWKYRPIAIGASWYRLLGKSALYVIGDSVGRKLAPLQFAVGIPDGISIAASLLQNFRNDDENAILSIDLSNAFNSIRRSKIYAGLKQFAPQLLSFFKWSYAEQTQLRTSTGTLCGYAATGTRQGDPLSMLYFAVGIHSLIEKLSGKINQLNPERNFLQSYADDISLCIEKCHLGTAWKHIAEVFPIDNGGENGITTQADTDFETIGLAVNPTKCFAILNEVELLRNESVVYSRNDADSTESPNLSLMSSAAPTIAVPLDNRIPSFVELEGTGGHTLRMVPSAKIFGVMIGTLEDRIQFSTDLYDELQKKGSYISSFCGPKAGFSLVKYCLNTISNYLHRIEDESTLDLARHDQIISKTLADLLEKNNLTHQQDLIRGLPHKLGGLGILRHDSPITKINHDDLQRRTISWIEHCGLAPLPPPPNTDPNVNTEQNNADNAEMDNNTNAENTETVVDTRSDASQTTSVTSHRGLYNALKTFKKLPIEGAVIKSDLGYDTETRDGTPPQKRKLNVHKRTLNLLMSQFKTNSATIGDALWLDASAFNGSGDLLLCGSHHLRHFNEDEFRAFLETKLLMNPSYTGILENHINTKCDSCHHDQLQHPMVAKKYHYLNCLKHTRDRRKRHNVIAAHLAVFLQKAFSDTASSIDFESHMSNDDNRRGDVSITWADLASPKTHFDVGVTSPVLNMLVSRMDLQGRNGHINSLGAATATYEDKRRKYKDTDGTFYPIIFLATGRPSKQLTTICQELHTRSTLPERVFMKHWRTFLRDSMRTCSKFIANAHRDRPHLHEVHHQPTSSQMKSRREQTQRIRKLTKKYMDPAPKASNTTNNINTDTTTDMITENNDGTTSSSADATSGNTSTTDMILDNKIGNRSRTSDSQTDSNINMDLTETPDSKTTGTNKTDSKSIADLTNGNNNMDSSSNTETPINNDSGKNNTDSSGNADTATTTLHDNYVEDTNGTNNAPSGHGVERQEAPRSPSHSD